jgi:hypothetical protein
MPSAILTALPSIHATIIGIAGSVITAYALYAHQELEKIKLDIKASLEDLSDICTPQFVSTTDLQDFLKEDDLDWDGVGKAILYEAKSKQNVLNEALLDRLQTLLYLLFTSFPFTGAATVIIHEVTEKLEAKKKAQFDLIRLQEIKRRVSFLVWCWHTQKNNIINLAQKKMELETKNNILQQRVLMNINLKNLDFNDDQKQQVWDEWHAPYIQPAINYTDVITDFFERAVRCNEALPSLQKLMIRFNALKKILMLKTTTKTVLAATTIILLFGVFIPPIMLYSQEIHLLKWHENLEYFLLIVTGAPYFLAIMWLWNKISTTEQ